MIDCTSAAISGGAFDCASAKAVSIACCCFLLGPLSL